MFPQVGPSPVDIAPMRPNHCRLRPKFGQSRPMLGEFRPKPPIIGIISTGFGQLLPGMISRIWPTSDGHQRSPTHLARTCPALSWNCQISPKVGPEPSPNLDRVRPPTWARSRPDSTNIGRASTLLLGPASTKPEPTFARH